MKIFRNLSLLFLTIILFSCQSKAPKQAGEQILVDIDNGRSTISLNEYLRRAEYVPRPAYCNRNTYLHKKIILNSLVAEKLLALEAGDDNPITQDESFQAYITGRREQAMRQWMHHVEATDKVVLDTADVRKAYQLAGREYDIEYYSISDTAVLNYAINKIEKDKQNFSTVFEELTGTLDVPQKKVKWTDAEHDLVHNALFGQKHEIGQVLKPIKFSDSEYLFIKVNGWSDLMAMTDRQQRERLDKVNEKLTGIAASQIWNDRVADIMRGKKLDFNRDSFEKLSKLFFAVYFHTDEERKNQFIDNVWGKDEHDPKEIVDSLNDPDFLNQPFFSVDGEVWTVSDFRKMIKSHPLVYRERKMPSTEFASQFRLAVADLVRDYYVTQEAYKKGYDKVNVVQRNVDMWHDSYVSIFKKRAVLDSLGEKRSFVKYHNEILEETLNPYIRELQQKYYKKIELDFELFESISLSTIDLFVKQPEQPFKYVVPMFPIVTSNHLIDYATKMEK